MTETPETPPPPLPVARPLAAAAPGPEIGEETGEEARRKGDEGFVRARFWPKVRKVARRIPFAEDAVAAYYCLIDDKTPRRAKGILATALAYFIVPTDMIPDIIAALGFTDDAAVLAIAIRSVAGHIKDEHREQARAFLEGT